MHSYSRAEIYIVVLPGKVSIKESRLMYCCCVRLQISGGDGSTFKAWCEVEEAHAVQIPGTSLGTFLFPQANGHVSQDQEEPVYLEGTARARVEDETQVGALLGSVSLPLLLHWCSEAVSRNLSANSEKQKEKNQSMMRVLLEFCCQGWSAVLVFLQSYLCVSVEL